MIGPAVIAQYGPPSTAPTPAPQVINVGANGQILIQRPAGTAKAVVILLPRNTTNFFIDQNGFVGNRDSFTVRAIPYFLNRKYATVLVTNSNLIDQAIADSASIAQPVFLLGVDNGAYQAVYYVLTKPSPRVEGLVLAPPMTQNGVAGNTSVTNFQLKKVHWPTLIVQNRQDACPTSLPNNADQLTSLFANATILWENSFAQAGDKCGGMSPHGFLQVEAQTVYGITQWIAQNTK